MALLLPLSNRTSGSSSSSISDSLVVPCVLGVGSPIKGCLDGPGVAFRGCSLLGFCIFTIVGSSCSVDSFARGSPWLGSSLMCASEISWSGIPPGTDRLDATEAGLEERIIGSLDTGLDVAALEGFLLGPSCSWLE